MHPDSAASRTALGAARHRATHQLLEDGALFRDPLAVAITGDDEQSLRERDDRRMRWFVCARSRWAEQVLADAVDRGTRQLVVLGAGLDTFGYRNPYDGLRVVEVDHPATQAWKRQRLAAAGIVVPETVAHLPIDFERQRPTDVLAGAVDFAAPVVCWWLGVTPYLTEPAIWATLTDLAGLAEVTVVLDHAAPAVDPTADYVAWHESRRRSVARLGEPWLSEYDAAGLRELALDCGFDDLLARDEVALIRHVLGLPEPPGPARPRATHLAMLTRTAGRSRPGVSARASSGW